MDYIVIIIIAIAILLLALMASQIDIEIEPQKYNVPKILIKFKKDSSLYSFLKSSPNPNIDDSIQHDEPYINTFMIGEAHIKYGDDSASLAKCEVTLKAIEDGIDKYYYFGGDPNIKFKRVDGFLEKDISFKAVKSFSSWDGTAGSGPFFSLHRITLSIKRLYIGSTLKLKYKLQTYGHYREVTKGIDITYHGFFFRCLNTTQNAVFKYVLPNGKQSKIIRFDLICEFNNKEVLNHELEIKEGLYILPQDYGIVWISINEDTTSVLWEISKLSPRSTIYKLKWYTEAQA